MSRSKNDETKTTMRLFRIHSALMLEQRAVISFELPVHPRCNLTSSRAMKVIAVLVLALCGSAVFVLLPPGRKENSRGERSRVKPTPLEHRALSNRCRLKLGFLESLLEPSRKAKHSSGFIESVSLGFAVWKEAWPPTQECPSCVDSSPLRPCHPQGQCMPSEATAAPARATTPGPPRVILCRRSVPPARPAAAWLPTL